MAVKADKLLNKLKIRVAKAVSLGTRASVVVGYTQNYALYVHERLDLRHPVGKAMYLIDPFRELKPIVGRLVQAHMKSGKTIEEAVVLVGLELQARSQEEVPVDTSALKNSAFTRLEE